MHCHNQVMGYLYKAFSMIGERYVHQLLLATLATLTLDTMQ